MSALCQKQTLRLLERNFSLQTLADFAIDQEDIG